MQRTTVICDGCGKELSKNLIVDTSKVELKSDYFMPNSYDVCAQCTEALINIFRAHNLKYIPLDDRQRR